MKKGVIFDQDGILFDTEQLYSKSWRRAGERMGVPVPDEFCFAVSGSSGQGMLDIIRRYLPQVDPAAYRDLCFALCVEEQNKYLPEKPGLHEILEFLHQRGLKLAVASSSQLAQVERNLTTAGIRAYFDAIITGESVTHGKPHPEIFLRAAELLELSPEDCYVFEDSFNGVRAGHAAGCYTVMIPDLIQPDEEISQLYDRSCKDFFEVIGLMKQNQL